MPEVTSENTAQFAQSIEPGTVRFGEWEIRIGREGEETIVFYGEGRAKVPDGYGPLVAALARAVDGAAELIQQQKAVIDELAEDPDVAVPATTRDDDAAIQQVAEIAVKAVFDRWLKENNRFTASDMIARDAAWVAPMTEHFASLLGHYSRRTENLIRERDGLIMQLQDAQKAEWQAAVNSGYWHQRCCYVEEALLPFADAFDAVKNIEGAQTSMGTITLDMHDTRVAHLVLSEMRKDQDGGPGGSYERFARDNRQIKILDWAQRTFTTDDFDPTTLDERAFRFLEEALELWQSAMHLHLTEANGGQAFCIAALDEPKDFMRESLRKFDRLVGRVLSGDPGEIDREFGGTMTTLAALAQVTGHSLAHEEVREFTRVVAVPRDTFQARHQVKRDAGI